MHIPGDIHSKHDLPRMCCIGKNIQETSGFDSLQNHFPRQSAILETLLVRIAGLYAHLKKASLFQ